MKPLLEPTRISKKKTNSAFSKKLANEKMIDVLPVLGGLGGIPKKAKQPYFKFYKVFKNDTTVVEVFTNDLRPFLPVYLGIKTACVLHSGSRPAFSLSGDGFGFLSRTRAMEYAKAGALRYIAELIECGESAYDILVKYREEHYDDLNFHLTDRNIKKLEREMES